MNATETIRHVCIGTQIVRGKYPLNTLSIPGPLMPLFQSICCSSAQPHDFKIYPTLPKSTDLHRRTPEGAPLPVPSSWLIPNIPELIGLANRLCSQEARKCLAAGNFKGLHRYNPLEKFRLSETEYEDEVVINGYNWTRKPDDRPTAEGNVRLNQGPSDTPTKSDDSEKQSDHDDEKEDRLNCMSDLGKATSGVKPPSSWYFATPGLACHLECSAETTKNFINQGHRLKLPKFAMISKFDTLERFLGLEKAHWFEDITKMMSEYSRLFKEHGDFSQCPVVGPGVSQVIIRCTQREQPKQPQYPGDTRYIPSLSFKAHTINLGLTDKAQRMAFFSQLNTLYSPDHPFMGSIHNYEGSYMTGPFWQSSTIEKTSNYSVGCHSRPDIFLNLIRD